MFGYTHTAAHGGAAYFGSAGWSALRQRYATLPGVSLPSSVVRSIMLTARRSPASLALVLMLRLVNDPARSSTMTWSTDTRSAAAPLEVLKRVKAFMPAMNLKRCGDAVK